MAYTDDPQVQSMIESMPERTGKSLEEWFGVLGASGLEKHGQMMKLLKGEYGLTHGYANTITLIYRQQKEGGKPEEEDLVNAQYQGVKASLKPVYNSVVAVVRALGPDVEIAPKKTYVSLRRSKQFAIVQAAAQTRVDLGLNLRGVEPTERLEEGNVFGGMCTHRIRLANAAEVDDQVAGWLKQAYDAA